MRFKVWLLANHVTIDLIANYKVFLSERKENSNNKFVNEQYNVHLLTFDLNQKK